MDACAMGNGHTASRNMPRLFHVQTRCLLTGSINYKSPEPCLRTFPSQFVLIILLLSFSFCIWSFLLDLEYQISVIVWTNNALINSIRKINNNRAKFANKKSLCWAIYSVDNLTCFWANWKLRCLGFLKKN